MPQDPMTTLARRPEVAVVVIGGPDTLFQATHQAVRGLSGVAVVQAGITDAAGITATRTPFAIVIGDELYTLDSTEFDSLASAVGATLISSPTRDLEVAAIAAMLEPRVARAHGARFSTPPPQPQRAPAFDNATIAVPIEAPMVDGRVPRHDDGATDAALDTTPGGSASESPPGHPDSGAPGGTSHQDHPGAQLSTTPGTVVAEAPEVHLPTPTPTPTPTPAPGTPAAAADSARDAAGATPATDATDADEADRRRRRWTPDPEDIQSDPGNPFRGSSKTQPIYVDAALRQPRPAKPPPRPDTTPLGMDSEPPTRPHPAAAVEPGTAQAPAPHRAPERTVMHGSDQNYRAVTPEMIAAAERQRGQQVAPVQVTPLPPPQAIADAPVRAAAAPAERKAPSAHPAAAAPERRRAPSYARRLESPVPAPVSARPDERPPSGGPPAARPPAARPPAARPPAARPATARPATARPATAPPALSARQAKLEAELSEADRAKLEANRRAIAAQKHRIESEDYYSLLGLKPDDGGPKVKAAFDRIAPKWDPSRVPSVLEDMREDVALIYRHILEAREILTDPERRRQYAEVATRRPVRGADARAAAPASPQAATDRQPAAPAARPAQPDANQAPHARPAGTGRPGAPLTQQDGSERSAVAVAPAQHELARAERSQRRMREHSALDHVDKALAMDSDNPNVHALRGYLLAQATAPEDLLEPNEAMACIERALKIDPNCERAYHFKGMVLKRAGLMEEAVECFEHASDLDPDNVDAKREIHLHRTRSRRRPPPAQDDQQGLLSRLLGRKD